MANDGEAHAQDVEEDDFDSQDVIELPFQARSNLAYEPLAKINDCDVLDVAHRLSAGKALDGRAGDRRDNVSQFFTNFAKFYAEELHVPRQSQMAELLWTPGCHMGTTSATLPGSSALQQHMQAVNSMLHNQEELKQKRSELLRGQVIAADEQEDEKQIMIPNLQPAGDMFTVDSSIIGRALGSSKHASTPQTHHQ